MNKFRLFFSLALVAVAFSAFGQSEPLLHPKQIGSYAAPADAILVSSGSSAGTATEFKTAAALGIANQTLSAGGSTSPTIDLSGSGGSIIFNLTGGLTGSRSGNTITLAQTAGATYTATSPIVLTSTDFSLANSGATAGTYNNVTVTAKGLVTGGSNVAYLTAEVDGSTTNEIQALTRTATNNTANLSVGGGTASVEDLPEIQEFSPTSGTTITLTGTLPTAVEKYRVERNGIVQNYGAGKGVVSIVPGTGVVTFTRAFTSGEIVRVIFPKQ
jgi:hypothetical protein